MYRRMIYVSMVLLSLALALPIQAADRASPDAAVRAYLQAAKAGDLKAARDCLHADGKDAGVVADVFAGMMVDLQRLTAAARAKFGKAVDDSGVGSMAKEQGAYLDTALKRLDRAKAAVTGDAATLTLPDRDKKWDAFNLVESDMVLTKAADGWRIDVLKTMRLKDAGEAMKDEHFAMFRQRLAVIAKFVDALNRGQFKTFEDFDQRYEDWAGGELTDPFAPGAGDK